jgi:hypothetical protein
MALAAVAALAVAGALPALSPAVGGSNDLQASLKGKDEVPGPGAAANTSGKADFKLKKKKRKICFTIIHKLSPDDPLRGHIHAGAAGVAGDIVVTLFDGATGRPSPISGCVKTSKSLIKQIKKTPEAFYCNLHSAAFPNGAIRGQLKQ